MICSSCGHEIMDGSKFCINCGAKLEEAVNVPEGFVEEVAEEVTEAPAEAADTSASVDETLNTAQEAYEQAASDLSDTADQAANESLGKEDSSSSFYESNETYTEYSEEEEGGGNIGFAIASLVCGCLSILCCSACGFGAFPIVGIVMGAITLTKKYDGKGFAIAGLITAGLGIILSIIFYIIAFSNGLVNEFM